MLKPAVASQKLPFPVAFNSKVKQMTFVRDELILVNLAEHNNKGIYHYLTYSLQVFNIRTGS